MDKTPESEQDSGSDTDNDDSVASCIRGKPKSGRSWKTVKNRFSSMDKVKPLRTPWQEKMKKKQSLKMVKAHETEIKEAKKRQKEEARKRIEERKKREEENARRAEVVQPIKNTAKIRRMKRKQLRAVEKR